MRDDTGSLQAALRNGVLLLDHNPVAAVEQATAILEVTPGQPEALRLLGKALRKLGLAEKAAKADLAAIQSTLRSPDIQSARTAIMTNDLAAAERILRTSLSRSPNDVVAAMMLAEIATTLGIHPEAERLLRQAVSIAPDYPDAKVSLALTFFSQGRLDDALTTLDGVIADNPKVIVAAATKADILAQTGSYDAAAETYRKLLAIIDDNPEIWLWYGHLLKTMGRQSESVAAYRRATALNPELAEAWWSLAELKANKVEAEDLAMMRRSLDRLVAPAKRLYLHFALGKALEDRREWEASFRHYAEGNKLRLDLIPHDRGAVSEEVDRSMALFTSAFFSEHAGMGCQRRDPIFVIGMPRAGSTLIEQILASHSQIEGTSELPDIPHIVQSLVARDWQNKAAAYPAVVADLTAEEVRTLGERYVENSASKRKTSRPFFIDKLPNNWRYLGLIHLILPNAKIIDARRDAMACCFSNFRQHFSRGQTFAYSMQDLGSYYRDYVRAMDHFDETLPGLVYRVQHESLVADPEREIRALLDYLGLSFEESCLRPHENARPVRTASSEQVRQPINRDAFDLWRHYEPWLDELKAALAG
ncbi:tetratricopeptide repeat-containing sulfotransferase family protein [Sphingomonas asaccharolytica]|uniref:tetratricopeptide repeat-containing sulfotransferase family protein n=1 Tax=Sphingomonas asaccharolytica TaxID=40681 RepID=UPI00082F82E1|nr:tetratricopeptide repeat-containing sulfotransferase family protein [Sphingomonas asaccharolytica]